MPQSDWSVVWMGIAAISLALMALMQLGAVVALLMAAKEARKTVNDVRAQIAPLLDRGQALIVSANDVVHQTQGVVSRVAAQVGRVEDAVTVASGKVADIRESVRPVAAQVAGVASGVRTFWSVLRGRDRGVLRGGHRDPRDIDATAWETGRP